VFDKILLVVAVDKKIKRETFKATEHGITDDTKQNI
jgi:hypothetical protein